MNNKPLIEPGALRERMRVAIDVRLEHYTQQLFDAAASPDGDHIVYEKIQHMQAPVFEPSEQH